jgi:hypothetical protein
MTQEYEVSDCCKRPITRHSVVVDGVLWCDRACYIQHCHKKYDDAMFAKLKPKTTNTIRFEKRGNDLRAEKGTKP